MQNEAYALDTGVGRVEQSSDSKVSVLDPLAREARECFQRQAVAIAELSARLEDGSFGRAVRILHAVEGHVLVTGIGKSGLVGQKIAATLASTGTPSFFLHAAEAYHGDLGMVTPHDGVLLISYSGETEEVTRLLPHLQARGIPSIALVGNLSSTLAREVDVALDISVDRELCPNNLAPTNSTLATLAMGDALSVSLIRLSGFDTEDFARLHPGGDLGQRLHSRVRDAMVPTPVPTVSPAARVAECVFAFARGRLPVALVLEDGELCGMVDEQRLRDALQNCNGTDVPVRDIMNPDPAVVHEGTLLREAELRMDQEDSSALVAIDACGRISGVLLRNQER